MGDYALFDPDDARFVDVPLTHRCFRGADPALDLLRPISRYVDGFLGLRRRPQDLVFAAIVGIPEELQSTVGETPDFDAILTHPDMLSRPPGSSAEAPCASTRGEAVPARRIVEVAEGLAAGGAGVSLASICAERYDRSTASILRMIGARLPPV